MKKYNQIGELREAEFVRLTGITRSNFCLLVGKIEAYISEDKAKYGKKRSGLKISKLSTEDRLLIVLYYMRHYPTFINLGNFFDISEGYCYKIYKKYSDILVKVEKLPNRKTLLENKEDTVIIDVSEQAIDEVPLEGRGQ